jgi:hypothetical protein
MLTFNQDLDENPKQTTGRKWSALDMTPSISDRNSKHQNTHGQSASRLRGIRSGTDAMFSMAEAIESLAD